jgi:hypothetical protein
MGLVAVVPFSSAAEENVVNVVPFTAEVAVCVAGNSHCAAAVVCPEFIVYAVDALNRVSGPGGVCT